MDRAIKNTIRNIRRKWKKIGNDGRRIHSLDIAGTCA